MSQTWYKGGGGGGGGGEVPLFFFSLLRLLNAKRLFSGGKTHAIIELFQQPRITFHAISYNGITVPK